MWRSPIGGKFFLMLIRNTPTAVGKIRHKQEKPEALREHPHRRGEDEYLGGGRQTIQETPPRSWGRIFVSDTGSLAVPCSV